MHGVLNGAGAPSQTFASPPCILQEAQFWTPASWKGDSDTPRRPLHQGEVKHRALPHLPSLFFMQPPPTMREEGASDSLRGGVYIGTKWD